MSLQTYATEPIGVLSHLFEPKDGQRSFALTNALLMRPVPLPPVMAHFWTLTGTVILGMQDTRLPAYQAALKTLDQAGIAHFVRNSGGLGVVSDHQVLNCTLFLPPAKELTINAAYQLMTDWLQVALPEQPLVVGEVPTSYCPGSFDLSLNGRKVAGMAQRRNSRGIAVMAYISVGGDQPARGRVMQTFYQAGRGVDSPNYHFPEVDPASMTTLNDALDLNLSVGDLRERLLDAFNQMGVVSALHAMERPLALPAFRQALAEATADMAARNAD